MRQFGLGAGRCGSRAYGRRQPATSEDGLYRLQVSATAALLLSAMRKGVLDLTRSGPEPEATGTGPTSDRAETSLPRPVVPVQ